jgi:hypothetical protein
MSEYEIEPVRGLPEPLPPGEAILWQGSPDWRRLARDAFHTRKVAIYFGLLAAWRIASGISDGEAAAPVAVSVGILLGLALAGLAVLAVLAWLSAKATVYTLTTRRIVMRFGVALPLTVNIPYRIVASADAAANKDGSGDIAIALSGADRLGYLALWPHARPWRVSDPQPMLRAIPDVERVADLLADAVQGALAAPVEAKRLAAEPGRSQSGQNQPALVSAAA